MSVIKAVLYDMDGVLVEAKDWHYEALNKALGLFGMEINRYDHIVTYDGLPTKMKLEMLSLEMGFPNELHGFINLIKQQYTMDVINQKCKPLFIHEYALFRLKKEGMLMGVCSNSIRKTVEAILDKSMIIDYFNILMSAEDVSMPKPNSEIYVTAMNKLGVKPEETLILEDNENGIRSAIDSGCLLYTSDAADE